MKILQWLRQQFGGQVEGTIEERPTPDGTECGDVGLMNPVEGAIARLKRLIDDNPELQERWFSQDLDSLNVLPTPLSIERMQMEGEVRDEMNRMRSQHERHRRMFHNALSFEPQPVRSQRPKIKPIPKLCQGCQWLSEELRGDFVASAERLLCAVQPTGPDSECHCSEFEALPVAEQPTADWIRILDDCEEAYDER